MRKFVRSLFLGVFAMISSFLHFLEKRCCGLGVLTLEPTSPAALRRSRDTERSDDLEGFERSEVENLRHYERAALVV